jgi:hypothetical protein
MFFDDRLDAQDMRACARYEVDEAMAGSLQKFLMITRSTPVVYQYGDIGKSTNLSQLAMIRDVLFECYKRSLSISVDNLSVPRRDPFLEHFRERLQSSCV